MKLTSFPKLPVQILVKKCHVLELHQVHIAYSNCILKRGLFLENMLLSIFVLLYC